ncbi:MAG TPA: hypothetical protein VJ951_04300 [Bacteroidales bacterium]|nr:hypothetical protein [Bacteroidales bacterium]
MKKLNIMILKKSTIITVLLFGPVVVTLSSNDAIEGVYTCDWKDGRIVFCYHSVFSDGLSVLVEYQDDKGDGASGGTNHSSPSLGGYIGGGGSSAITPGTIGGSAPSSDNNIDNEIPEEECICEVPCPECGGCTDATVPEGCEPCSCCENNFNFKCIDNISPVCETKIAETYLWNAVRASFNVLLAVGNGDYIATLLEDLFNLNIKNPIEIQLCYDIGTYINWDGKLIYGCSDHIIRTKKNERISTSYTAPITRGVEFSIISKNEIGEGYEIFYSNMVNVDGVCILPEDITRDGVPMIGEPVYLEFVYSR